MADYPIMAMIFFVVFVAIFLVLLLLIIWIWALIECLTSTRLKVVEKLFWFIIILLLNIIGAALYFIFSKSTKGKIMTKKEFKGKKLLRIKKNRVIAGVCGGIGKYFNIDPTLIRLVWAIFTILSAGGGILAYIVAWIIIPEEKKLR